MVEIDNNQQNQAETEAAEAAKSSPVKAEASDNEAKVESPTTPSK